MTQTILAPTGVAMLAAQSHETGQAVSITRHGLVRQGRDGNTGRSAEESERVVLWACKTMGLTPAEIARAVRSLAAVSDRGIRRRFDSVSPVVQSASQCMIGVE